jgi:hypothetical protein
MAFQQMSSGGYQPPPQAPTGNGFQDAGQALQQAAPIVSGVGDMFQNMVEERKQAIVQQNKMAYQKEQDEIAKEQRDRGLNLSEDKWNYERDVSSLARYDKNQSKERQQEINAFKLERRAGFYTEVKRLKKPIPSSENYENEFKIYKSQVRDALLESQQVEPEDFYKMLSGNGDGGMTEYQAGRLEAMRDRNEFNKDRFDHNENEQDIDKATKFVKNTKQIVEELRLFNKLDDSIPGGLYGEDNIKGFGFGASNTFRNLWKTDEMANIRLPLQALVNRILKNRSGAAVTATEFDRLEREFGINTSATVEEFRLGLQNYYGVVRGQYDDFSKADPESAGKVYQPPDAQKRSSQTPSNEDLDSMTDEQLKEYLKK